jgi:hypothetical protein
MDIGSFTVDLPTATTDPCAFLVTLELTLANALRAGDLIGASTVANLIVIIGRARQGEVQLSMLGAEERLL